jgi:hypothetical protein
MYPKAAANLLKSHLEDGPTAPIVAALFSKVHAGPPNLVHAHLRDQCPNTNAPPSWRPTSVMTPWPTPPHLKRALAHGTAIPFVPLDHGAPPGALEPRRRHHPREPGPSLIRPLGEPLRDSSSALRAASPPGDADERQCMTSGSGVPAGRPPWLRALSCLPPATRECPVRRNSVRGHMPELR